MKYIQLIRFKKLLLLVFLQFILRYGFLKLNKIELALPDVQYCLLVLSTVLIVAGGYVLSSILKQQNNSQYPESISISKSISENEAYNIYFVLNIIGVLIGYYLSNQIQRPGFLVFFILIATLLYFYATQLQQIRLLQNIVVALMMPLSIIIIGFFDLFPATDASNKEIMRTYFSILLDYAFIAFIINFSYEIIKDLENARYSTKQSLQNFNTNTSKYVAAFLLLVAIIFILLYINNYLVQNNLFYATFYILFFITAPLIYVFIRLINSKIKAEFYQLSTILQWIIFLGILSVFIISKNIIHNVI